MRQCVWAGLISFLFLVGCKSKHEIGDQIYFNGDILTMESEQPTYVEAIVVKAGRIVMAGTQKEAIKWKGEQTEWIDLKGQTLLPGFIDAHGHVWNAGFQAVSANLLAPPDGVTKDIAALQNGLRNWAKENQQAIGTYGWIVGFGYDDAQLAEQRHPTAADLDNVSTDIPVLVIHQSGHLGAMNSKALELAGYTQASVDPVGGVIRRGPDGKAPNGVLEEMALFNPLFSMMAKLDQKANVQIAQAGLQAYMQFGFTTAQEGRATEAACTTWEQLADQNQLPIDIAAYPDLQSQEAFMKNRGVDSTYRNHFRVAGVKLSLDGSPQGKTAWLTKPYQVPPVGKHADYTGYPAFESQTEVNKLVDFAFAKRWQVLAHCNGDAAIDSFIEAVDSAQTKYGKADYRPVAIHAQTVREDQLDRFVELGIFPSFFGMHTYYWGDWHRDQVLGNARASRISPAQTARNKELIYSQHHDAPVALPSSMVILHSVVNRISRSGVVIGPEERVSAYDALRSLTIWAAYQYFEQEHKGSIAVGKLADFVVLDRNPLKVSPAALNQLRVQQTIKEGKVVYTYKPK